MNAAHLHIILVHVPVVLIPFGVALLMLGIWKRNITLRGTAHSFFVVAAVFTVVAFLLGDGAEEIAEQLAGVVKSTIESHEEAAEVALWFAIALGVVSLGILAASRFSTSLPMKLHAVVLIFAVVTTGILGYSAQLGGKIRHPEAFEPSLVSVAGEEHQQESRLNEHKESDD